MSSSADDATLTAEAKYSINFTKQEKKKLFKFTWQRKQQLILFVNEVKACKFKAKDSELNAYPVCLGNISKGFANDNMK